MTAFWALAGRARAEAALPPAPAPEPPPEEPKDCIVILTFASGRRDLSCASLMTAVDARTEAEAWRKRVPDGLSPGRIAATVHRIGEPL